MVVFKEVTANIKITFSASGTKDEIMRCIGEQVFSDMNVYWQNDDDTAQMKEMRITRFTFK